MVRVRRTEDGPRNYYNHARRIRLNDDQPVVDVSDEDAEYLVEEHGGFAYAEDDDEDEEDGEADESVVPATLDEVDEAEETESEAADVDEGEGDAESGDDEYDVDLGSRSDLESLRHPDLKAIAEQLDIAEETDLRSRDTIIDAILDHVNAEG